MASVREQILEAIETSFAGMTIGLMKPGLPAPFTCQFTKISREPLDDLSWKQQYSLGIHDMEERKTRTTMFYMCSLPVVLEFRTLKQATDEPSTLMNRVLFDIQRWLALDYTWGGLAINTVETGNSFYIDDENQKKLSGAVMIELTYRHYWNDPSRQY